MLDEKTLIELQKYVHGRLERPTLFNCYELSDIVDRSAAGGEFDTFSKGSSRPSFGDILRDYIDKKGVVDADIFYRAGIDPGDFARLRDHLYQPGKNTVIALAMALELHKIQTDRLLGAAGYALSNSDAFDLVIQFCLEKEIYGMDKVNQALHIFGLEPLGGMN